LNKWVVLTLYKAEKSEKAVCFLFVSLNYFLCIKYTAIRKNSIFLHFIINLGMATFLPLPFESVHLLNLLFQEFPNNLLFLPLSVLLMPSIKKISKRVWKQPTICSKSIQKQQRFTYTISILSGSKQAVARILPSQVFDY
jgi:hypothetical protein